MSTSHDALLFVPTFQSHPQLLLLCNGTSFKAAVLTHKQCLKSNRVRLHLFGEALSTQHTQEVKHVRLLCVSVTRSYWKCTTPNTSSDWVRLICVYINIDSRENNKGLSAQLHMLMLMMMRDMTWPRFPVVFASWFAATKSAGGAAAVGDLHSRHNNTRYTHKYALAFPFAEHLKLLR